jgi:hypothetical protein
MKSTFSKSESLIYLTDADCFSLDQRWPLRPRISETEQLPPQYYEPSQIVLAMVIYQCVPCLPEVTKHLEYELIEADPEIPQGKFYMVKYLKIPMVIVEYVSSALEGAAAVEHHKDHLLMAMSTGCSFYAFLKLREPIFGFLIDANLVEILIGWPDDLGVSTHNTANLRSQR